MKNEVFVEKQRVLKLYFLFYAFLRFFTTPKPEQLFLLTQVCCFVRMSLCPNERKQQQHHCSDYSMEITSIFWLPSSERGKKRYQEINYSKCISKLDIKQRREHQCGNIRSGFSIRKCNFGTNLFGGYRDLCFFMEWLDYLEHQLLGVKSTKRWSESQISNLVVHQNFLLSPF